MARFLKPLVRSGGYYPSRRWTPLVYPGGYTTANGGEEPAPTPIEKTITGNPIHILDALAKPAQALSVKMEPVQDLHGYDSPWPAGGGVNLLDPAKCSVIGPGGAYGLTVTHDQATAMWTISGTPTSLNTSLSFNFCTYSDFSLSGKGYQVQAFPISGTPIKSIYGFRNEAENRIAIIIDTVANPTVNMTFKVSVAATAQAAWTPYSNICPITGHTEVNVYRTGTNVWDEQTVTGALIPDGTIDTSLTYRISTSYIPVCPKTSYRASNTLAGNGRYAYYDADKNLIAYSGNGIPTNTAFTTPDNAYYLRLTFQTAYGTTYKNDVSINYPSTDTSYHAYSGTSCPISWQTEAGTVYGGTIDVATGVLTVDRAMVDLGTKKWYLSTSAGRTRFRASITDVERISSPNIVAPMLCSAYKTETANNTYTGKQGISLQQNAADVYVYDPQTESMTTAEFKSAMSGVQLVYKLATPITYDLTPTEVTLLLGENNIWSDGEMTLTYLADGNASDEEALNP